jgi:DNA-binding GntR family transcriptional regulator
LNPQKSTDSSIQSIYEEIRERISLLDYPPGTVLSENALAQDFGVSRSPIRRVLERLEFEGLVVSNRGVGTIVTTVDLRSLREVFAMRMKLHEITGELSPTVHVAHEDIAFLEELLEEVTAMSDGYAPRELGRLYNVFQNKVLPLVNNRPLREISAQLYYQTSRVWLQILPDLDWEEEVNYFADEIKSVAKALRTGDMQAVAQIRAYHLSMMLARIKRYLGGASVADLEG